MTIAGVFPIIDRASQRRRVGNAHGQLMDAISNGWDISVAVREYIAALEEKQAALSSQAFAAVFQARHAA